MSPTVIYHHTFEKGFEQVINVNGLYYAQCYTYEAVGTTCLESSEVYSTAEDAIKFINSGDL